MLHYIKAPRIVKPNFNLREKWMSLLHLKIDMIHFRSKAVTAQRESSTDQGDSS